MTDTPSRRDFLAASAGATAIGAGGLGLFALGGCAQENPAYQNAIERMTAPLGTNPTARDLIRFATLAANGHNTQPWLFEIRGKALHILPDVSRRTPIVDPDDHHLYASLGCAVENLAIAAQARGMRGDVAFESGHEERLVTDISPSAIRESVLFDAIPHRQCTRRVYDGTSIPPDAVDRMVQAAAKYDVDALYVSDQSGIEAVLELVVAGNSRQMNDPAFLRELKEWIRFNPADAAASGDGLYTASSGNPILPAWIGSRVFDHVLDADVENQKYTDRLRSSAGIVVFVARSDDKQGWINAGRAYQRAALQMTADGIKHAFVNQAVEVPDMRRDLQALLNLGTARPNLIIHIGYADAMPKSLRRPVTEVLV